MNGQYWGSSSDPTRGNYSSLPQLSNDVRIVAQPRMLWRQLVDSINGFGKNRGDIVCLVKAGNIKDEGGVIAENEPVKETYFSYSRSTLTIQEYSSKAVPLTNKLIVLSQLDPESTVIKGLVNDQVKVLDKAAAEPFRATDLIYTPTGSLTSPGYSMVTTGIATATATRECTIYDLHNIIDMMEADYKIPYWDDNGYICVATTKFLRGLMNDKHWEQAALYGDTTRIFNNEIGRIAGIGRFIRENHVLNNSMTYGGEAIFIGADAVTEIVVQQEEIQSRVATDFGRNPALRWSFIGGWGSPWDYSTDGEARIVRVYEA